MKFVKAQKPCFGGERRGDELDRIVVRDRAGLHLVADVVQSLVGIGHEFVKVRAAPALHRAHVVEQVHQHGLAAADLAVDVESLDRVLAFVAAEQPAELRGLARETVAREPLLEPRQPRGDGKLRRIALDLPRVDQGVVAFNDGGGHRWGLRGFLMRVG